MTVITGDDHLLPYEMTLLIQPPTSFQRLDNDQEGMTKNIVDICGAKSINEFVVTSRSLLECAGIVSDDVQEFTDTFFEIFGDLKLSSHVLGKDYTVRISHMLR